MDIHHLDDISTFFLIHGERHLRGQFVVHSIGIQGELLTHRYRAGKEHKATAGSSRDCSDVAFFSFVSGWATTREINTREFLTRLEVIRLRTIPTIVEKSNDPGPALTFGIDGGERCGG